MRSPSNYSFSQVPRISAPRSTFRRDHTHKTTFDAGYLTPFYIDEVLPGDTHKIHATLFGRLATPIVPVMDNLHLDLFYFFVPNRLVWANWQKHMGELDDPADLGTDYLTPILTTPAGGFTTGSLADYFGIPVGVPNIEVSALPFRAYNLIHNEWFRHQDVIAKALVPVDDGPDAYTNYDLKPRFKRHDYFTSALPWPQKAPGVTLPLGDTAPVIPTTAGVPTFDTASAAQVNKAIYANSLADNSDPIRLQLGTDIPGGGGFTPTDLKWNNPALQVNLSQATSATINSLRQAFQIQRLYERDARSGTRYTEILRAHFGVVSPDARLQRPEYLGGSSQNVNITPIAQTSATGTYAATPQGNLAAIGTFTAQAGFTKSFTEHGYIIGLMEVRADLTYSQGLHRMWSRRTRFDYYWPVLAHLGEQAILNKEIYAQGSAADDQVFGYQERWSEYRYAQNRLTGLMRHNPTTGAANSLDIWHYGQEFTTLPTLSAGFMADNTGVVKRASAVPTAPDFILDALIRGQTTRPMPTYSVPGLIDHF